MKAKKIIILLSLTLSQILYADCDETRIEEMTNISQLTDKNEKSPQLSCKKQNRKPSDKNCLWLTSTIIDSNSKPKCLYYQFNINEEIDDFIKNKKISKIIKEKHYAKGNQDFNKILAESDNLEEELNKLVIEDKDPTLIEEALEYLPSFDLEDMYEKIKNPASLNLKYAFNKEKTSKVWKQCQSESFNILPNIDFSDPIKMATDLVDSAQDQMKEQANELIEEAYATMYDLTSDEAVMKYFIMAISSITAKASCSIQSQIPSSKSTIAQKTALTQKYLIKASSATNQGSDKTSTGKTESQKGCFVAVQFNCLALNQVGSGAGIGGRTKEKELTKEHKDKQSDAAAEAAVEKAYNDCMKTEPAKIQKKILSMLEQSMNGVDIELFAIKKCNDEEFKKGFADGALGDKSKEDKDYLNLFFDKIVNGSVSYLDEKQQAVSGFVNKKIDGASDFLNKTNSKQPLLDKFNAIKDKYKATLNQSNTVNDLLDKFTSNKEYSYQINNNLAITKNTIFEMLNNRINVEETIGDTLKEFKNKKLDTASYKEIMQKSEQSIIDFDSYLTRIFSSLSDNTTTTQSYECISYDGNNKCLKFGLRNTIYQNIDSLNNDFFQEIILDRHLNLSKGNVKNYATFISYMNNLDIMSSKSEPALKENISLYLDYIVYDFLKNSIMKIKQMETKYNFKNLKEKDILEFIKVNNKLFRIVFQYR